VYPAPRKALHRQGLYGRRHGHAVGAGHAFEGKAAWNHLAGGELLYLATVVSSVFSGIKDGNRTDAALAGLQGTEKLRHTPGDGIDGPQSGVNYPVLLH